MKKYLFLIPAIMLAACNTNLQNGTAGNNKIDANSFPDAAQQMQMPIQSQTDTTEMATETVEYVDSFRVKMDSLMTANIKLPPIYKYEIINANSESVEKFSALAKVTGGKAKILVNSDLVAKELVHTINIISAPQSDLLILIDKTGSMAGDIELIRHSISQIIDTVKKYRKTRLAVAFYGDKNVDGPTWYQFRNFETDYEAARSFVYSIIVDGGGDWPESVYDAVYKSMESDFWHSATKRNIILVGDAPPLEKPLSDYTLTDILNRAKKDGVVMNFYPIIITPTVEAAKVEKSEIESYKPLKLSSSIYPNPCNNIINVGFDECAKYYMEIYNAAGQEVVSEETYGIHWSKDLRDVPDGFYILRIIDQSHKFELHKFVVKH